MKVRILGLVLLVGLVSRPALATTVSIQPETNPATVGATFFVDIDIADAANLVSFQFDLKFDPAILSANDPVVDGGFLGTPAEVIFFPGTIDNTAGTITLTAAALSGNGLGASGNGTLAKVSFTALALGSSVLTLSDPLDPLFSSPVFLALVPDGQGGFVIDPTDPDGIALLVEETAVSLADSSVRVEAAATGPEVPEPSTLVLIGTGLAAAIRRRRANRAA